MILRKIRAALLFCFGLITSTGAFAGSNPSNIPAVSSIAALRALSTSAIYYQTVNVSSYYSGGSTPSCGIFNYNASSTATDNGGTIIQPTGVATGRYICQVTGTKYNATWFGAYFDGTHDDTTAITNAITAVYNLGGTGGTVTAPAGTACVTTIPFNWTFAITVNFEGAGESATVIKHCSANASPIFNLSANTNVLDVYSSWSNFSVQCSAKGSDGIKFTTIASFSLVNVKITACDKGINAAGFLVSNLTNVSSNSNNIGYYQRKSGSIYSNLVAIKGGSYKSNSTFGMDLGEGAGTLLDDLDMESNGTSANTATGALVIRSTVDDETGYATIAIRGSHFESNLGQTVKVEAASGLALAINDGTFFLSDEGGRALNVGAIESVNLSDVQIPTPGGTAVLAAVSSKISNSIINTVTDTSGSRQYFNLTTSGELISNGGSSWVAANLVAGSHVFSYPLRAGDKILCLSNVDGGSPGSLRVTNEVANTSFTVTSSNGADTSYVACQVGN